MSIYAVINSDTNICDNVIVLDEGSTWTPPETHYTINIDGLSVGIGFHYDPATQVWTSPPSISASFNPNPIFLSQYTTLTWVSENATSVTVNGVAADLSGLESFTPDRVGKFSVIVTATNVAGSASQTATVNVVATQAELVG
jgi:hypothetical protein